MNIEQLIQLSPVPIKFINLVNNSSYWAGAYFKINESVTGKAYIEILNKLDNYQKIITLTHEIAHANCDTKGCKCMKNPDYTEREIHANKFTLSWLLKYKQKEALKQEMKSLTAQANGYSKYEHYVKAAKHIMKLKLWQKCLDYVGTI